MAWKIDAIRKITGYVRISMNAVRQRIAELEHA
jgi:hypothetical protein